MTQIKEIFYADPTRSLEEVQKVNALEEVELDVREFYETESAKQFLLSLSSLLKESERSPFLYLHATFGSGKTHLLKLIGLATGSIEGYQKYAKELADHYYGFKSFRKALYDSKIDHLIPVFLNLLDRESKGRLSLPLLIYRALGQRLNYPTDPLWVLEWAVKMDIEYDLWSDIHMLKMNGHTFKESLVDRASLRPWLYKAVPSLEKARSKGFFQEEQVKESIIKAKKELNDFTIHHLVKRVNSFSDQLQKKKGGRVDFLFGLDEVALYIGDDVRRFEELLSTVNTIKSPIIGTGQWSLQHLYQEIYGKKIEEDWYQEVELKGSDTEIIVQNRWLKKKEEYKNDIKELIINNPFLKNMVKTAGSYKEGVDCYPFRYGDLKLLRQVMQGLLMGDSFGEHEHIQGRALLVIVRSLFTKYDWGKKELGSLVPWSTIYDILTEDTTFVPTWVQDLIHSLQESSKRDEIHSKVVKSIYLLNHSSWPTTSHQIALLLMDHVSQVYKNLIEKVEKSLDVLQKENYLFAEKVAGEKRFRLLSQEEISLAEKMARYVASFPSLKKYILSSLQEHDLFISEDVRREIDLQGERKIPLSFRYTILRPLQKPHPAYHSVVIRVLVSKENPENEILQWQEWNSKEKGLEDLLIVLKISSGLQERIERSIAREEILEKETKRYLELETIHQEEKRELKKIMQDKLEEGLVYEVQRKDPLGKMRDILENIILTKAIKNKFPNRKVLSTPLQILEDAYKVKDFFQGGGWPLDKQDAHLLGVNLVNRTIDSGWCKAFMEDFSATLIVKGEDLLDLIEGKQGIYLGTPLESLQALLITLSAAKMITLKRDGSTLSIKDIGKGLRTREEMKRLEVRMEPPVDEKIIKDLLLLSRYLCGTTSSNQDVESIISHLSSWFKENYSLFHQVEQSLFQRFPKSDSLNELKDALLKLRAGEIDKKELTRENILLQAKYFYFSYLYFYGNEEDLWKNYEEKRKILESLYSGEEIIHNFTSLTDGTIPSPKDLRDLLKRGEDYRCKKMKKIYFLLTGEECGESRVSRILDSLEEYLYNRRSSLLDLMGMSEGLPGDTSFHNIKNLINEAIQKKEIYEKDLVHPSLEQELLELDKVRNLLSKDKKNSALWDTFLCIGDELKKRDPHHHLLLRFQAIVNGKQIPDEKTLKTFIKNVKGEEPVIEDDTEKKFQELWERIEKMENGQIVLFLSRKEER